jgi:hypothetical protein
VLTLTSAPVLLVPEAAGLVTAPPLGPETGALTLTSVPVSGEVVEAPPSGAETGVLTLTSDWLALVEASEPVVPVPEGLVAVPPSGPETGALTLISDPVSGEVVAVPPPGPETGALRLISDPEGPVVPVVPVLPGVPVAWGIPVMVPGVPVVGEVPVVPVEPVFTLVPPEVAPPDPVPLVTGTLGGLLTPGRPEVPWHRLLTSAAFDVAGLIDDARKNPSRPAPMATKKVMKARFITVDICVPFDLVS